MQSPPDTEREPITETLHGESITGPYRWLEGDDDRVAAWEQRQNEHTDAVVETETREALAPAFRELGYRESFAAPTVRGGRYFQRIEAATAEQPRLTVREDPESKPRTLVELASAVRALIPLPPRSDRRERSMEGIQRPHGSQIRSSPHLPERDRHRPRHRHAHLGTDRPGA